MKNLFLILSIIFFYSNSDQEWTEYKIDKIYEKVALDKGTLDENGRTISFIFVPTVLEQGKYEISISDAVGDLYLINNTKYYIKFWSLYGFAGFADEGILVIGSNSWSNYFYKKN